MQLSVSPGYPYPYVTASQPGISIVNPPVDNAAALWIDGWGMEWLGGLSVAWNDVSQRYSMDTYSGTVNGLLNTVT
jgi:hypothetical protein